MTIALAGVAVLVVAGGVVAASARDPRNAVLGLLATLALGAFLSDPIPHPAALAVRVVAALLAAAAMRSAIAPGPSSGDGRAAVVASSSPDTGGTGLTLGWASTALLATAGAAVFAAIAGALAGVPFPADGSSAGTVERPVAILGTAGSSILAAAGGALLASGLAPMLLARSIGRATVGLLLVGQGAILVRGAITGAPPDVEQVGFVLLVVAISLGGAALGHAERREIAAMRRPRAVAAGDALADLATVAADRTGVEAGPLPRGAGRRPTDPTGAAPPR